jgi:hypothetical protein
LEGVSKNTRIHKGNLSAPKAKTGAALLSRDISSTAVNEKVSINKEKNSASKAKSGVPPRTTTRTHDILMNKKFNPSPPPVSINKVRKSTARATRKRSGPTIAELENELAKANAAGHIIVTNPSAIKAVSKLIKNNKAIKSKPNTEVSSEFEAREVGTMEPVHAITETIATQPSPGLTVKSPILPQPTASVDVPGPTRKKLSLGEYIQRRKEAKA